MPNFGKDFFFFFRARKSTPVLAENTNRSTGEVRLERGAVVVVVDGSKLEPSSSFHLVDGGEKNRDGSQGGTIRSANGTKLEPFGVGK